MATGRTVSKHTRVYVNGYDLSGYGRKIGPLSLEYAEANLTTFTDAVKGYLPNTASVNLGALNAVFDNTATTGLHALESTAGAARIVTVAMGIRAAPAIGDPCFGGSFEKSAYQVAEDGGAVTVNLPFGGWSAAAASLLYASPWGVLLNANTARTAANTATGGPDNPTAGATTHGGYMVYHVTASSNPAHTATISVDDSADDTTYGALSGATTGSIIVTAGVSGIVALAPTATVKRYLRWQVAFGTATSVTFVLSFHRGYP